MIKTAHNSDGGGGGGDGFLCQPRAHYDYYYFRGVTRNAHRRDRDGVTMA